MKKTFLDLGMQPLANNFSKKYIPQLFRLKLKFDTNSKLVEKLFKELSKKIKKSN
tara:strand:+ start:287 stop:451 length:165 start_codon:yes stop_codon:yes gene_type:complete